MVRTDGARRQSGSRRASGHTCTCTCARPASLCLDGRTDGRRVFGPRRKGRRELNMMASFRFRPLAPHRWPDGPRPRAQTFERLEMGKRAFLPFG